MDMGRMLFAVQNKDQNTYVPVKLEEKGIQAEEIKVEAPVKKKKESKVKEIDPEVRTFQNQHFFQHVNLI